MQVRGDTFPIARWQRDCPVYSLKEKITRLKQNSKTLKSLLDNLILCIIECDRQLGLQQSVKSKEYLQTGRKEFYRLVAIITDDPSFITSKNENEIAAGERRNRLLRIKAIRRIDSSYLPNHLPEDPFFSSLRFKLYSHFFLEDVNSALEKPLQGIENEEMKSKEEDRKRRREKFLIRIEEALRKKYQRQRLAQVVLKDLRDRKLLRVQQSYWHKETLPKRIQALSLIKVPKIEDMGGYFNRFEQIINLLDGIETTPRKLNVILIKPELKKLLEKWRNVADIFRESYATFDAYQQAAVPPYIIKKACLELCHKIKSYEKIYSGNKDFAILRQKLNDKVKEFDPDGLVMTYLSFAERNPKQFHEANGHLKVNYFTNKEREPYRIHLYKGLFYRCDRLNEGLHFRQYNSRSEYSHKKNGWISFVMNSKGEIFGYSHGATGKGGFLHSTFMAGGPVIFAGEMKVGSTGNILAVSNYSGHYEPTIQNLAIFASHLHRRGVNLSSCKFYEIHYQLVNDKISAVNNRRYLSTKQKERAREGILDASQQLKYSICYRYKNNNLAIAFNYKKAFLITGLIFLSVVSLILLAGIVAATSGAALPVVTPALVGFAGLTSPAIATGLSIATASLLNVVLLGLTATVSGAFHYLKEKISIGVGSMLSIFSNKNSLPLPKLAVAERASQVPPNNDQGHQATQNRKLPSPLPGSTAIIREYTSVPNPTTPIANGQFSCKSIAPSQPASAIKITEPLKLKTGRDLITTGLRFSVASPTKDKDSEVLESTRSQLAK